MQNQFFYRRFFRYFIALTIPTLLVFLLSFGFSYKKILDEGEMEARQALARMNTSLEQSVNTVAMEMVQFVDSANMSFALKNILRSNSEYSYRDSLNLRVINAMTRSIKEAHPYIDSIFLYIDESEHYFSSVEGRALPVGTADDSYWLKDYYEIPNGSWTILKRHEFRENGKPQLILTACRKLLVGDGAVVLNIDIMNYVHLLSKTVSDKERSILISDATGNELFGWGNDTEYIRLIAEEMNKSEAWSLLKGRAFRTHRLHNETYDVWIYFCTPVILLVRAGAGLIGAFLLSTAANFIVMLTLSYYTTKKNFLHITNIIDIFRDAERGIYREHGIEARDEYGVIMNNIIQLFLHTVRLNSDLKQREYEQQISQLVALQSQINPHFLFNTLQTLAFEVRKLSPERSLPDRMIEDLTDILKFALADPMESVSIKEELRCLKKYVAIQKLRFGDIFIPYYEVDDELMDMPVFRMLLQPLVENSILHGIRYRERGYVRVQVFIRNSRAVFRITDNGIGMDKEELSALRKSVMEFDAYHIGLSNVNNRLRLYFGDESLMQIRSRRNWGTVIEFSIPKEGLCKKKTKIVDENQIMSPS